MIHTADEYKLALARLTELHLQLAEQREEMRRCGISDDKIEERISELKSSCDNVEDDIAAYERCTCRTWVPSDADHPYATLGFP
jgi:hypothetical protein